MNVRNFDKKEPTKYLENNPLKLKSVSSIHLLGKLAVRGQTSLNLLARNMVPCGACTRNAYVGVKAAPARMSARSIFHCFQQFLICYNSFNMFNGLFVHITSFISIKYFNKILQKYCLYIIIQQLLNHVPSLGVGLNMYVHYSLRLTDVQQSLIQLNIF